MKVRYRDEVANHSGPESCGGTREGADEALIGETDRPGIEPRNQESGRPTLLSETEGNTEQGDNRKSCDDPARSEAPSMSGSLLPRSWEVSSAPVSQGAGGTRRRKCDRVRTVCDARLGKRLGACGATVRQGYAFSSVVR